MSKVFKAVHILNRGSDSEVLPGTLFIPSSAQERDEFVTLEAIVEASEAETALFNATAEGSKTAAKNVTVEAETATDDGDEKPAARGRKAKAADDGDIVG